MESTLVGQQPLVQPPTGESIGSPATSGASSLAPRHWWQWVLLYPTLFVSLLGSVPTVSETVKSIALGVRWGRSSDARQQQAMWEQNLDCVQNPKFSETITKDGVQIGSMTCESSGAVLVYARRPGWANPRYRWLAWADVADDAPDSARGGARTALLDLLVSSAYADALDGKAFPQQSQPVLCQRMLPDGKLLQRIKTATGCMDQIINTRTGLVISSQPAPCTPDCGR